MVIRTARPRVARLVAARMDERSARTHVEYLRATAHPRCAGADDLLEQLRAPAQQRQRFRLRERLRGERARLGDAAAPRLAAHGEARRRRTRDLLAEEQDHYAVIAE